VQKQHWTGADDRANVGYSRDLTFRKGIVDVSSKHQRVNLCYCASDPDGVLNRHKVYIGLGRMSLRPVHGCCSYYLH